jgi:hypothetical protein
MRNSYIILDRKPENKRPFEIPSVDGRMWISMWECGLDPSGSGYDQMAGSLGYGS